MSSFYQNQSQKASPTGPRQSGPPAHTNEQRRRVLDLLRKAGPSGIPKLDFTEGKGLAAGQKITQVAARIFELERAGYKFEHRKGKDGFTTFVLSAEPVSQPAPPKPKLPAQANLEFQTFIDFEMGSPR